MRLVCPNCGAQYEVPDEVIPQTGRDVQCSSCGVTWFHAHPDHNLEPEEELDAALGFNDPAPEKIPLTETARQKETGSAPSIDLSAPPEPLATDDGETSEPAPDSDAAEAENAHPAADAAAEISGAPRRELDPAVAEVLRQEAEYEARARAAESDNLESQPDLGLAAPDREASRREREARLRMALLRGMPDTSPEAAPPDVPRRELLPDIEEINSTLRSTSERRGNNRFDMVPFAPPERPARRGFRTGFSLMIGLAIILFLLYAYARPLAAQFPVVEPHLASYVTQIDHARLWLDDRFAELMQLIGGVVG